MNSRERVLRALNHQSIDRAPRDLWVSHEIAAEQADAVAEISARYPSDIVILNSHWLFDAQTSCASRNTGTFTDAWGCTWQVGPGSTHALASSPPENADAAIACKLPCDLLENQRFAEIDPQCNTSARFTLAWSDAGPLVRLEALRANAATELHSKSRDVLALLQRIHEFHCQELTRWCQTNVDAVAIADELLLSAGNHLSTKSWRTTFKPLLRAYCKIAHDHDKFLFLYCTRAADELLADLVEMGVDAVHLPWTGDPERIPDNIRRRITFWGGQEALTGAVRHAHRNIGESVLKVRHAFDYGAGGVIAHCRWQPGVPLENVATFYENWMIPLPVTA